MNPQNYPLASPSDRIVAGIIDLIVAGVIQSVLYFSLWVIGLFWLSGFLAVSYLIFRDSFAFLNYQSIGKKIIKLKVLKKKGAGPLDFKESFKRNLIFLPNLLNSFGFTLVYAAGTITLILLIFELYKLYNSSENQRFGDELAETIVVKESIS